MVVRRNLFNHKSKSKSARTDGGCVHCCVVVAWGALRVHLRAAGPQRGGASAIPGGCTQNTLKSFEGSIEVVENQFIN